MRYHFDLRGIDRFVTDLEGSEFDDVEDAKAEVAECAKDLILKEIDTSSTIEVENVFEVRDERGTVVHSLPFSSVLLSFMVRPWPSVLGFKASRPVMARSTYRRRPHLPS